MGFPSSYYFAALAVAWWASSFIASRGAEVSSSNSFSSFFQARGLKEALSFAGVLALGARY